MNPSHPSLRRALLACACILTTSAALAADLPRIAVSSDVPPSMTGVVETSAPASAGPMTVAITLPLSDEAGAAKFADSVSKPGNRLYGQYLTPAQFAAKFGANAADYEAVTAWAQAQGLTLHEASTARTLLSVAGTRAQIERAFGVTLKYYKDNKTGRVFPSATSQPSLPSDIAPRIDSVLGLSRRVGFAPKLRRAPANAVRPATAGGTGAGGAYAPADFRTAYEIPQMAATGPAETLAVFEQGGYFASDVTTFVKANKLTMPAVTPRLVDDYGGGVDSPDVELETVLDISTLIGITQGNASILVYEDGEDYGIALIDSLTAMADDDKASIISISYGEDEALAGQKQMVAEHRALLQLAAQGQTVLASSGDSGAYGDEGFGLNVSDPCSQVYVTCVGGTTLFTGAHEAYNLENAWNDLASYDGATGGGVSSMWALPKYQLQPDSFTPGQSVAAPNGGSNTFRNVPDVAADADPLTGAAIYSQMNGGWVTVGGTSLASPIYAGFLATYDQVLQIVGKPHVGFFNPALYDIGTTILGYYANHDVRNGTNGDANEYGIPGYSAGYNYDLVSGWGTPAAPDMLNFLLSNVTGDKHPPADATDLTGGMTGTTISLTWHAGKKVPGYIVELINPYAGTILATANTVGTSATFTGVTEGLSYYAVYLYSISGTGSTVAAPLYVQAPSK